MGKSKKPDYYKILGLTVKANDKDIKNAAVKLLHKYRPDVYKQGDAQARSEEIIEARDILLNEDKRAKYDRYWLENYSNKEPEVVVNNGAVEVKVKEEATSKSENKFWTFCHKLQLPEREVNKKYPFLFHVYNWKTDGMIFVLTALIIPLIALMLLALVANMGQDYDGGLGEPLIKMGDEDASPLIFFAINIVSNIIGFVIFWQRDSKVFVKSGFVIFYSFIFIVNLMSIIAGLILGSAIKPDDGKSLATVPAYQIAIIWFQIVAEAIVLWIALAKTKDLKERIWMTIKQNWKMLLITIIIAGVLLFVFITFVMPGIFHDVPAIKNQSSNEKSLEDGLKNGSNGYRAGYAISLFILTIFIAPLTEELATRHAIYSGVSNKTIALFVGALYFAMLHVEGGDVEHIFNYFIGGLFLSGVFSISRGNVTYDTGTHMVYNLITFIVICAQDMHA